MKVLLFVTALFAVVPCFAKTIYVNAAHYGRSGMTGESEALAYGTLQEGVGAAETGDTVLVAEGDYDQGGTKDGKGYWNRAILDASYVNVKATGRREKTRIIGAWDKDSTYTYGGVGANAVRCFQFTSNAYYSVLEGFTLCDGACHTEVDDYSGYAGGVLGGSNNRRFYAVNCEIIGCVGVRGSATRYMTCVRCRISGNRGGNAAGRESSFLNCEITGNPDGLFFNVTCVGCTIAANGGTAFGSYATGYSLYNCVYAGNYAFTGSKTPVKAFACVFNLTTSGNSSLTYAGSDFSTSITDADFFQFISPLTGDCRLLPDSPAVGKGDAQHITTIALPPATDHPNVEIDPYLDLDGKAIAKSGAINAGARQTVASVPATGALLFTSSVEVDGRLTSGTNLYAFSEVTPAQIKIKSPTEEGVSRVFWYNRVARDGGPVFPQPDDSAWMLFPPIGIVVTNTPVYATKLLYVSPTGNDDADGFSTNTAKRTLQAAADDAPAYSVVLAAPGDYAEGGKVQNDISNRLAVTKQVRIVGAGIGKSIIRGAADPTNPSGIEGDGRGPKACRCVLLGSNAAVQGFTLTDGFTDYYANDADGPGARGGGFSISSTTSSRPLNSFLLDCLVTNCVGRTGGATYAGTAIRCRISDCWGSGGGTRYTKFVSCVFDHGSANQPANQGEYAGGFALMCTFIENPGDGHVVPNGDGGNAGDYTTNCVFLIGNGQFGVAKSRIAFNDYWGTPKNPTQVESIIATGGIFADPLMYAPEKADGRPLSCSPVIGAGQLDADAYTWLTSGFGGDPVLFVDGRPTIGAFQATVQAVVLAKPRYGAYSTPATLTNGVDIGETLTVRLADSTRPCAGFVVDGVTNLSDDASWAYTAAAGAAQTPGIAVEPLYLPHWYVDAEHGDDGNSGFTAGSAKRTLKAIMDLNLYGGDTVHAAEGVYSNLWMTYSKDTTIRTRVVVAARVALVADGRREATVIEGEDATTPDALGCGSDAMRCVALSDGSSISGFTLRGGRTGFDSADYNSFGGGVAKGTSGDAVVRDCIITNCCASRGGGAYGFLKCVNCLFVDNRVSYGRSAMSQASAYGCVFTRNRGNPAVQNCGNIVNCTFFDNYTNAWDDADLSVAYDITLPNAGSAIYNTICKGPAKGGSSNYFYASNCLFNATYNVSAYKNKNFYDTGTIVTNESFFVFSPEGMLLSADHPAVDATSETLNRDIAARFPLMDSENDILGEQRVSNGTMDIGACEYDWRGEYACAIGGGVTVETASPDVKLVDGKVRLTDGCALGGTWSIVTGGKKVKCSAGFSATGEGTLTGNLDDGSGSARTVTVSDGSESIAFKSKDASLDWSADFAGDGSGTVGPFDAVVGGLLLIVR